LSSICNNFTSVGVSGFGNDDVLSVRPYGGCSVLWPKNIASKITVIESGSGRVCAVLIKAAANPNLLCRNVYFPRESCDVNMDKFQFQLAIITDILERHPDCEVLDGGDFNVDFSQNKDHTLLRNDL